MHSGIHFGLTLILAGAAAAACSSSGDDSNKDSGIVVKDGGADGNATGGTSNAGGTSSGGGAGGAAGASTAGAGGGSTCVAAEGSCSGGETCCSGLECCAGVPVPVGSEYCGSTCPRSDRSIKRDFSAVDANGVLERVASLPIATWSYKTEEGDVRHMGPMAQDFKATFGLGASDKTILQVDGDGVALAAIQALHQRLTAVEDENRRLRTEIEGLRDKLPFSGSPLTTPPKGN